MAVRLWISDLRRGCLLWKMSLWSGRALVFGSVVCDGRSVSGSGLNVCPYMRSVFAKAWKSAWKLLLLYYISVCWRVSRAAGYYCSKTACVSSRQNSKMKEHRFCSWFFNPVCFVCFKDRHTSGSRLVFQILNIGNPSHFGPHHRTIPAVNDVNLDQYEFGKERNQYQGHAKNTVQCS